MADNSSMYGAIFEGVLSAIGQANAQGDHNRATQLYQDAVNGMSNEEALQFKKLAAPLVADSNQIGLGSEGRTAQSRALSRLQQLGDEGGMDAQARLAQQQALSTSDQNARGNREAIMQGYARRGMQNSGSEMEAQLSNASNSANSARDAGLSAASEARNRALSALQGSAQVGSQMRGQDIGVQESNQAAENARNAFNAKMTSATDQYNGNEDLAYSLARIKRLQALADAQGNLAGNLNARGNQTAGNYASIGRAGNNLAQAWANSNKAKNSAGGSNPNFDDGDGG